MSKNQTESEFVPPPPPPLRKNHLDSREKQGPTVARAEEDIFVGEGVDYAIPGKDLSQSPLSEDMEESPRTSQRLPILLNLLMVRSNPLGCLKNGKEW